MKTLLAAIALAAFLPVHSVSSPSLPVGTLVMRPGAPVKGVTLQSPFGASLQGSSPKLR